jgi:CRP-like cAMP-binding protein
VTEDGQKRGMDDGGGERGGRWAGTGDPAVLEQRARRDVLTAEHAPRKRTLLGRAPVFARLDAVSLDEMVRRGRLLKFARRRVLVEEGGPASTVYVVGAGRLRVGRRVGDVALTLSHHGPGDLVGEQALADDGPSADSIVAHDTAEVLAIPARPVSKLVRASPAAAQELLRLVFARRRAAEQRLVDLLGKTVEQRLAALLLQLARGHGIPQSHGVLIGVRFTHAELAAYVFASRETVTLALGGFKRRGLVAFEHRRIVVRDPEALARLV